MLLEGGADPNLSHRVGGPPLVEAALRGKLEVMRVLLEHGAVVDGRDALGQTALYHSASSGNLDGVRLLLDHDADPNLGSELWTPLSAAAEHPQVQALLLERGAAPGKRPELFERFAREAGVEIPAGPPAKLPTGVREVLARAKQHGGAPRIEELMEIVERLRSRGEQEQQ
jgi:ankyrin repeat protein